jgi:predicted permease
MSADGVWDGLLRDARYALRGLLRSPMFTLVAVLTLAIGTGANTAVFSVVDGVLLKPLPYPEPDELVAVWHDAPGAPGLTAVAGGLSMSPSMLVTYREENRSFDSIGIYQTVTGSVTGLAEPEQVPAVLVSGGVLPTYGIPPLLGRWLTEADESAANGPVMVLGHDYWQRRFGGEPNVIGRTITVNSVTAEIVGVMPEGFRLGDVDVDLIGAMRIDPANLIPPPFCCNGVARLKPGVTLGQANADIERMLPIWIDRFPFAGGVSGRDVYLDGWRVTPTLRPLKADVVGNVGDVLWVVMAMIGIVLVIACANVTNLLLVRGERRSQEFGVRAALGAGSWPIARALLVESMMLALAGGLIGLAIGYGALQLLLVLAPPQLPRLGSIVLDERALAFALALTVVAGSLIGLAPVLRAARTRLSTALRGARGGSAGHVQQRAQNMLVVAQVALALVLLVSSGLMIRTFQALRTVEPGFVGAESLQTFRIQFPQQLLRTRAPYCSSNAPSSTRSGHTRVTRRSSTGCRWKVDPRTGTASTSRVPSTAWTASSRCACSGRCRRDISTRWARGSSRGAISIGPTSTSRGSWRSCRRASRASCGKALPVRSASAFERPVAPVRGARSSAWSRTCV